MSEKRNRSIRLSVEFGSHSRLALGWRFKVGDWFREALDIQWTRRIEERTPVWRWTEGLPPLYSFSVGDTIEERDDWEDRLPRLVQVVSAKPDDMVEGVIVLGKLTFDLWEGDPRRVQPTRHDSSQRAFARLLKTGVLSIGEQLDETRRLPLDVIIDYVDGTRRESSRRITVLAVKERAGRMTLESRCHTANATRSFLVDRIDQLITTDGEVIDRAGVEPWIRDVLAG
jgi:hypothetical protein